MCAIFPTQLRKRLQQEFVLNFHLCFYQCPPAAWCCTRAPTPPTATVSCCHPLTTSSRPSSPRRWPPPLSNQQPAHGDCHDQHARCDSSCVCHLPPLPSAGRPGCGRASHKPLIQLPPGEKAAPAQSRSCGTMLLALLEPTAPPPKPNPTSQPRTARHLVAAGALLR